MKYVILTGLIGSGKSTVLDTFFKLFGVPCIKTDDVAKTVRNSAHCQEWMISTYGQDIVTDGSVDLVKLRGLLFNSDHAMKLFNDYIQPKIVALVKSGLQEFDWMSKNGSTIPFVVIEMPFVKHMHQSCFDMVNEADMIVRVQCDYDTLVKRITSRNPNLSLQTIEKMIASQMIDSDTCTFHDGIFVVEKTQKNGQGTVTYTWEIDYSKPTMTRQGFEYLFNKKLVKTEYNKKPRINELITYSIVNNANTSMQALEADIGCLFAIITSDSKL
jgi:dephospho-CoA kinase